MDNDAFVQMRIRRQAALEEARRRRREGFCPHRVTRIHAIEWTDDDTDPARVTLKVQTGGGQWTSLPRFFRAHALYMAQLPDEKRTQYLRDIWLNYNAWATRRSGGKPPAG